MLNRLVKTNEDYALTIARLVLGILFFIQGALAVRAFHELVRHTERRRVRVSLAGDHPWSGNRFARFRCPFI